MTAYILVLIFLKSIAVAPGEFRDYDACQSSRAAWITLAKGQYRDAGLDAVCLPATDLTQAHSP